MRNSLGLSKVPRALLLLLPTLSAVGCLPQLNDPDRGPLNHTFAVSDYFTPSGFMGDGAKEGFMTIDVNQNCMPRPANAQGYCYHFRYYMDPNTNGYWGGVYWVFPANSWGSRPGYKFDPSVFKQVRFSAAVTTPTKNTTKGGSTSYFNGIVGKISANGFYMTQYGHEYDDETGGETTVAIGTDITSTMKQFTIIPGDLGLGNDPTELIGGFAWSMDFPSDSCTCSVTTVSTPTDCTSTPDPNSPTMMGRLTCPYPVDVYLDDIVWDTTPPADAGTP